MDCNSNKEHCIAPHFAWLFDFKCLRRRSQCTWEHRTYIWHCNIEWSTLQHSKLWKDHFPWRQTRLDSPLLSWSHDCGPNLSSCSSHHRRCCFCIPPLELVTTACFSLRICPKSLPLCQIPEPADDEDFRDWPPAIPAPPRCILPRLSRRQLRLPGPED